MLQNKLIIISVLFFFATLICGSNSFCNGKYTVIKHPATNQVLEVNGEEIQLKNSTEKLAQMWKLKSKCSGTFLIISALNQCAIELRKASGNEVFVRRVHAELNQQWYLNSDGTIVSAKNQTLALEVTPDGKVAAEILTGENNQIFGLSCHCYFCRPCNFWSYTCC